MEGEVGGRRGRAAVAGGAGAWRELTAARARTRAHAQALNVGRGGGGKRGAGLRGVKLGEQRECVVS